MTTAKHIQQRLLTFGNLLSAMVLPNIAAFIAWGLLAAIFLPSGWYPNAQINQIVAPIGNYLLPILLAFTGGSNVAGHRGGVVATIATFGILAGTNMVGLIAAMIIGPLAGWCVNVVDDRLRAHVPQGFEMLINNLSAGILGIVLAIIGYLGIGPLLEVVERALLHGAVYLVDQNLLPLANVVVEPAKVLFMNNAINHGLLTPLGTQDAVHLGKSVLFLVETNPGPGLGILLAYAVLGRGTQKKSAFGAIIIEALGGIHEIYFPFVLMRPALFLAVIGGGVTGTFVFDLLDVGLKATPSPGSLISILLLTPHDGGDFLGVLIGIAAATMVSFAVAILVLARENAHHLIKTTDLDVSVDNAIRNIVVTGTDGMGSPAMGAAVLRRKLRQLPDITISVTSKPINELTTSAETIFIVRHDLRQLLCDQLAEKPRIISIENYLNAPEYDGLLDELREIANQRDIFSETGLKGLGHGA